MMVDEGGEDNQTHKFFDYVIYYHVTLCYFSLDWTGKREY